MAIWAVGTKFQRGDGADPELFTDIGAITSISPPESTTDVVDATTLDAVDGYEEILPTLIRNGEATLNLLLDPADEAQTQLKADQESRAKNTYRILFPDGENFYRFAAYVTGFSIGEITPEGLLEATATLRATGKPGFDTVPVTP